MRVIRENSKKICRLFHLADRSRQPAQAFPDQLRTVVLVSAYEVITIIYNYAVLHENKMSCHNDIPN